MGEVVMDPDFWRQRWEQGQTGFHQADVNPHLVEHWDALGLTTSAPILVPLCGKSLDMLWLAERGHTILGVEFSPIAVRDFFQNAGLAPKTVPEPPFEASEANGIRILRGDFFDLTPAHLEKVRGVYDRAALIALPPNLRLAYARALSEKLPTSVRMLLLSFESTSSVGGPPFSVDEKEIRALYAPAFSVDVLRRGPFVEAPPHLRARGHESVADVAYRILRG